ncbi:unnamed protein product [Caenorhabditis brenneri]
MGEATTHPLLSLPDDEIAEKIQGMNIEEVLKFSLISEECKDLVESSELQETSINIYIEDRITVSVYSKRMPHRMDLQFYTEPDMYWGVGAYGRKKKLTPPQSVMVVWRNTDGTDDTTTELPKRDFTMENWMEHLYSIFSYYEYDCIRFGENSFEFDIDDIKEVFGNITKVTIEDTGCFAFNQSILQKFSPIELLSITPQNFRDSNIPSSVLMENRAYLNLSDVDVPTITLDELLMINSKVITGIQMSSKQLNQFIKLWQGGSNPRMEHLCVYVQNFTEEDEEIIMRGIKHQVIAADQFREFQSVGLFEPHVIAGGLDFHRMDGVKSTIQFDYEFGPPTFEMYVWFDHCLATITEGLQLLSAIMAQEPTHPLLSLPDDEIIRKLREMSLEEILRFSFISERCNELVKSIKLQGTRFSVLIGNDIKVSMSTVSSHLRLSLYTEPDMYWGEGPYGRKKKLTTPQSVLITVETEGDHARRRSEWAKRDCTMQEWLEHLQDIFSYHKIDSIWFARNSSQFEFDDIKEEFGKITEAEIENTGCYLFSQMILQKYFPFQKLSIRTSNLPNSKIPKSVLMQNFDELRIENDLETTSPALDELLLVNCKVIIARDLDISPKQLNKFIKLWQQGSNPHMEYLAILSRKFTEDDEKIFMKGINHDVIPADRTRNFKMVGYKNPDFVTGGLDIHRMDGVKATIRFEYEERISTVEMFVWMDHCVGE